ncbi:MAG: hypothetical protein K0R29_1261 [Pseudobdellovibrio sp.]|jgi:hypothetical protein|nr:hypothetical protein [Pseudobdellovibrio sp.]
MLNQIDAPGAGQLTLIGSQLHLIKGPRGNNFAEINQCHSK